MAQAQSGICAEANLHGVHLLLNVLDGSFDTVRRRLKAILDLESQYAERFSEAMLSTVIAIGAEYWPHYNPDFTPPGLKSFPVLNDAEHHIATRPFDLLIQIRSDREDVNHLYALSVMTALQGHVELVEQIKCFRFLDGRDFNGFSYGANVPHGRFKKHVALCHSDYADDQGSYVHLVRFRHQLNRWQTLSLAEQERIMGRTRLDNTLLDPLDEYSHAKCFEQHDDAGQPLFLHQGMPYGDVYEQGMLLLGMAAKANRFISVIEAMVGKNGVYDEWLDYCQGDLGSAYFAPSETMILALAKD